MNQTYCYLITLLFSAVLSICHAAELNVADPKFHPYADPAGAREGRPFADETVNEARLYGFYQRQADYYLANPDDAPKILPAFPGLDAGLHGHWGKHNQNGHRDGRWNEMGQSHFVGQQMDGARDAVAVRVSDVHDLSAVFSARANLSFYRYWSGGFVGFYEGRWGSTGGMRSWKPVHFQFEKMSIEQLNQPPKSGATAPVGWQVPRAEQEYVGFFDSDAGAIFSYQIKGQPVLDLLQGIGKSSYCRQFAFANGAPGARLALFQVDKKQALAPLANDAVQGRTSEGASWAGRLQGSTQASFVQDGDTVFLELKPGTGPSDLRLFLSTDSALVGEGLKSAASPRLDLAAAANQRTLRWTKTYEAAGKLATDDQAYVIDDIAVPAGNDNKSLTFYTDICFDAAGTAYLTTLMGEVWKVSGLDQGLKTIRWRKIATGLNQPFGIKRRDGKLFVLERSQLTVLEDRNGDEEIDFYGCFSSAFDDSSVKGSHTHTFGLEHDDEGNWYFVCTWFGVRVSADGKTSKVLTSGVRNCMGFGKAPDGSMLMGPQEGNNTPTSTVIPVRKGENHGFKNNEPLNNPLGYVPRGIDNSTGGFLTVDSAKWGPVGHRSLIGLSYGYGSWYQILYDDNAATTQTQQIASVPMPGAFASGVTRGAVNPVDGQVYAVGLDGWGDYSVRDGCFARLRYTGSTLYQPVGYQTFDNGILVRFDTELNPDISADKVFAQAWNYRHSSQYGSPEFAVSDPESLGHDRLSIQSVNLLPDAKSIFVEIPSLQPVMQAHLRMHLTAKDGKSFSADLFPTIIELGDRHEFAGAAPKVAEKNRSFVLHNDRAGRSKVQQTNTTSGEHDAHARKIIIKTIPGLKYNRTKLKVKTGESIALTLWNLDQMPHNLVVTYPGAKQAVGEAAFRMLNDPKALEKHYVPDGHEGVLAYTNVVQPEGKHTLYMTMPQEPGEYPYICTFPGHWQVMQGVFLVRK
ncbi:MAG: azurin [Rhodothermales bacterium]|jgi:azurin